MFKLSEHGTTIRQEVMAGVATFFAMAYILVVNPMMLSQTGMPEQGVLLATILSSVVATLIMGLYANVPYAMAPGMGLNAFFTYTVCAGLGFSWQEGLAMMFLSGVVNMILCLTPLRRLLIEHIPESLKKSMSAGIGVFLTYIGLKNAGLLQFTVDPGTYIQTGDSIVATGAATPSLVPFNTVGVLVALLGIVVVSYVVIKDLKAGLVLAMVVTTLVAIGTGLVSISTKNWEASSLSSAVSDLGRVFGAMFGPKGMGHLFSEWERIPQVILTILAFSMTNIFDNIGTLMGTGRQVGLEAVRDENKGIGLHSKLDKALFASTVATPIAAISGTSSVTAYVESAAGIGAGGRTGLTSVVVAGLLALSALFTPMLDLVPAQATAAVLLIVGIMMLSNLKAIDWSDMTEAIPAFFMTIFMGLAYSITEGIACGFIMYSFIMTITGRVKEIAAIIWILDILFILNFVSLALL